MPARSLFRLCLLATAVVAMALGGCSVLHKKKPELAYEERPVDLLYRVGAQDLDEHKWNDAVAYFREVERQHPYSEWSRHAILMSAYAHYEANDYAEAIADADRFISLYPGNVSTPYAYYLKAICYFEQIVDVNRDQANTDSARDALTEVVKRYPNTEYATDARVKLDMVADQLAGKEMSVGRFYLRAGNPIAAIGRFHEVVDKYQTTSHTPEALYRLVVCYLQLGLTKEATDDGAVLGYNYPGSIWYQAAYKLLTSKGLRPLVTPGAKTASPMPHLLPGFRKRKSDTLAPPAVTPAASSSETPAPAPATPGA